MDYNPLAKESFSVLSAWGFFIRQSLDYGYLLDFVAFSQLIRLLRILEDDVNDQSVKNVIAHELLHTVPGCFAHKGKWKLLAELVNSSLPDYKIKTTDSPESLGITSYEKFKEIKYTVVCTKCGMKIGRTRKSKLITNPERYRCAKCKGKLIVLDN